MLDDLSQRFTVTSLRSKIVTQASQSRPVTSRPRACSPEVRLDVRRRVALGVDGTGADRTTFSPRRLADGA